MLTLLVFFPLWDKSMNTPNEWIWKSNLVPGTSFWWIEHNYCKLPTGEGEKDQNQWSTKQVCHICLESENKRWTEIFIVFSSLPRAKLTQRDTKVEGRKNFQNVQTEAEATSLMFKHCILTNICLVISSGQRCLNSKTWNSLDLFTVEYSMTYLSS